MKEMSRKFNQIVRCGVHIDLFENVETNVLIRKVTKVYDLNINYVIVSKYDIYHRDKDAIYHRAYDYIYLKKYKSRFSTYLT